MLQQIISIYGLGIYRGKDSFLPKIDLKKCNVVYGYNGVGKTSLSRALRYLEKREIPDCLKEENPEVAISVLQNGSILDLNKDTVSNYSSNIRVFNSDFVWENIHWSKNGSKGIVTVSKEQKGISDKLINKQKELQSLRVQIQGGNIQDSTGKNIKITGALKKLEKANKDVDDLLKDSAKFIKESLWCSDKSFSKSKFKLAIDKVISTKTKALSEAEVVRYQQEASTRINLDKIKFSSNMLSVDDYSELLSLLTANLKKPVSRKAISSLKNALALEEWLKVGLREHKNYIKEGAECPVCENVITKERMDELLGHFNTEAEGLELLLKDIQTQFIKLQSSIPQIPIKERVHAAYYDDTLWSEYADVQEGIHSFILEDFSSIENKIRNIEIPANVSFSISDQVNLYKDLIGSLEKIKAKLGEHDSYCDEQNSIRVISENRLIENIALQKADQYKDLQKKAQDAENELIPLQEAYDKLPDEIDSLKAQIKEIGQSGKLINEYLESYLGHDRLKLSMDDEGYFIFRNGKKSAAPLSEGEKTALAFCYFIASIQKDAGCNIKETTVVIDDPVSSLDNRHIHYVFNFMREMVVDAKQLIILTHNFYFFKECQKWLKSRFGRNEDERLEENVQLLNIRLRSDKTGVYSALEILPQTLQKYETEYHYFSSKLFGVSANDNSWDEADLYGLANACRRVMESFFCFKLPKSGQLRNKFEELLKEMEKKHGESKRLPKIVAMARERFVNVASHSDNLDSLLGLDNITLDSVKDAVEFTLAFIEEADDVHYKALKTAARNYSPCSLFSTNSRYRTTASSTNSFRLRKDVWSRIASMSSTSFGRTRNETGCFLSNSFSFRSSGVMGFTFEWRVRGRCWTVCRLTNTGGNTWLRTERTRKVQERFARQGSGLFRRDWSAAFRGQA